MDQPTGNCHRSPNAFRGPGGLLPAMDVVGRRAQRRLQAIEEVLCRLPHEMYDRLQSEPPRFRWQVTDPALLGQVVMESTPEPTRQDKPSPASDSKVVELSTGLELEPWPVIVTVVVHELAHVILRHAVSGLDEETRHQQELQVWHAVREWGFHLEQDQAAFLLSHRTAPAHFTFF